MTARPAPRGAPRRGDRGEGGAPRGAPPRREPRRAPAAEAAARDAARVVEERGQQRGRGGAEREDAIDDREDRSAYDAVDRDVPEEVEPRRGMDAHADQREAGLVRERKLYTGCPFAKVASLSGRRA